MFSMTPTTHMTTMIVKLTESNGRECGLMVAKKTQMYVMWHGFCYIMPSPSIWTKTFFDKCNQIKRFR